jgi:hypothetical protein
MSRSDSGRRVDSSYTRPKSNVTRASEAATSRTNSDASWTWLIYGFMCTRADLSTLYVIKPEHELEHL